MSRKRPRSANIDNKAQDVLEYEDENIVSSEAKASTKSFFPDFGLDGLGIFFLIFIIFFIFDGGFPFFPLKAEK